MTWHYDYAVTAVDASLVALEPEEHAALVREVSFMLRNKTLQRSMVALMAEKVRTLHLQALVHD